MNRISCAALGVAFTLAAVTAAKAEDFEVPFDLPTGAVIHLDIAKTGERERAGTSVKVAMSMRYRQAVISTEEGYRIDQSLVEAKLPPEAQDAAGLLATAAKIVFDADADLSPLRIRDQAALIDTLIKGMGELVGANAPKTEIEALSAQVKQLLGSMTPEAAAGAFLKEQALLAAPQMMMLDLRKPLGGDIEVPNPFGGAGTLTRTQSYELKSLDKKAGKAVIEFKDALDPDSVKALIGPMMARLAPDAPRPTEAELAAFKIEQTTACRYEMDLKTGLTAKADCTLIRSALDDNGKMDRRVETIVMTQRLELP